MGYNGHWIDSFRVKIHNDNARPQCDGKIVLETPSIDYIFTKDQWKEFKEKVNSV